MNFQDIEMTQSYGLRVSSYSRTSQQHPSETKNEMRYSCYQCGGDSIKSDKCRCCKGLRQVSDNNVLVGLMMQVMCRKLGKDAPTIRNFPILQFSSQNRQGSKNGKKKFDQSNNLRKGHDYDRKKRMDPYSEGNSANQSNSLDSSLDSLDSSQNSRSTIQSKQKLQKNKAMRYVKLYQNQPNFRQQISQIKQQSYATEDYSVSCDKCHKQSDMSGDFMECRICKHFYICMKCYEERVEQIRRGQLEEQKPQLPEMKKQKSAVVQPTSMYRQNQLTSSGFEKIDLKNKSCQFFSQQSKNEQVNYDNFYQIHEHPLTRCTYPHDSDDIKYSGQEEDYVNETNYQHQEDQEQYTTYGNVGKSKKQSDHTRGSPSYKNLFKAYDSHNDFPQSPKKSPPYLDIEVIRQQKQSPSPSQKSDAWPIRESESQFDNNISMTISNNFQSPDSEKVCANKNDSNHDSPINANSDQGSPMNINNSSSNFFINEKQVTSKPQNRRINLFGNERKSLQKIDNKNQLINHIKINRDTSQWSQYSGLYQTQSVNTENLLNNIQLNQSNIQIMENQNQSQSRVIESPDQDYQDSKSVQSDKQSPIGYQLKQNQQLQRQKQKNYTQKKPNKFTSIRVNQENQYQSNSKNQQHLQRSPEVTLPQNLLTNFLSESNNGLQQDEHTIGNDSVELYPFISIQGNKKSSQLLFKQDVKQCSKCNKQILNRSMYMKCETCQKLNRKPYELCDKCYAVRDIITEHNDQYKGGNKHFFRALLYRNSGGMSIEMMDEEEDKDKGNDKLTKPQYTSRFNLLSSANSLSIDAVQNSDKKVREPQPKPQAKLSQSPKSEQQSQEYKYAEPEEDERTYKERQRKYNEQYLKRRQKKCQQNQNVKKMYENLILNSLFLSNRQSIEKERERLSASSNTISQQYRYSSNVGIDGEWLMEPLELERHTSVTCIGGERESANNIARQSITENPDRIFDIKKIKIPESQTRNIPQSSVNIIVTSNTLISGDKTPPTVQIIPPNKNTSIKLPGMININNNSSTDDNIKLLQQDKQSPSRQSIFSHKSGSPDRSQMSSRIKVDCGDSQSQFQHHQLCTVEEEQSFHKPRYNEMDYVLNKSIKLQQKPSSNILGNSYAVSEPLESDLVEEDFKIEQNKKPQKKFSSSYNYRIITPLVKEENETMQEVRPRSITVNKDERGKNSQGEGSPNKKKDKSLSKSGSEKESKKMKLKNDDPRMVDFLNIIDKSQKLSKSDNEEENSKQKKQKVHFNYEQDEEMPYHQFLNEQPILNNNSQQQIVEYFVFNDYACDQCGQTPVNVRYHCKICEDFDLCSTCYRFCQGHQHSKSNFEKICKRKQLKIDQKEEDDKRKQEQQRNNLLRAILDKFVPQKSKTDSIRSSLSGENKQSRNLGSSHWRMGHSLNENVQQSTKMPAKPLFMEKSNRF